MSCFSPNIIRKEWNKRKGIFEVKFYGGLKKFREQIPSDFTELEYINKFNYIVVPCGQCKGCRLDYSRSWADRCMFECETSSSAYFVTLTYDPEHVPLSQGCDEDGVLCDTMTLRPDDLTKFMKDFRRYQQYHFDNLNVRFFACGEYGDKGSRPHYHLILYNAVLPDLIHRSNNQQGDEYFVSDIISRVWNKGICVVSEVNWDTCAYTARYVMKKQKGKAAKEYYGRLGIEPEFVRMSRRPGIGADYYFEHKGEIYQDGYVYVQKKDGAQRSTPPKYYDRLYGIEEPDKLDILKIERKFEVSEDLKVKLKGTNLDYFDYLASCEENFIAKFKSYRQNI